MFSAFSIHAPLAGRDTSIILAGIQIAPFTPALYPTPCTPSVVEFDGLNQSQLYYVYYVDPYFLGGTITPIVTQNKTERAQRPQPVVSVERTVETQFETTTTKNDTDRQRTETYVRPPPSNSLINIGDLAHHDKFKQMAEAVEKRKPLAWGARGRQVKSAHPTIFITSRAAPVSPSQVRGLACEHRPSSGAALGNTPSCSVSPLPCRLRSHPRSDPRILPAI